MRIVHNTHPYFEELDQFSRMVVASVSTLILAAATDTIRSLGDFVNQMILRRTVDVCGKVSDHSMTASIQIGDARTPEVISLLNASTIHEFMAGRTADAPQVLSYEIQARPQDDEPLPDTTRWEGANPTRGFEMLTAYLIGGAYERYKNLFVQHYGTNPKRWDPALQFFRHLRNGCFHGNRFNLISYRGDPVIDPRDPPQWRSYIIQSELAMNNRKVVGGFFHVPQVIPFLDEMGTFVPR